MKSKMHGIGVMAASNRPKEFRYYFNGSKKVSLTEEQARDW